MNPILIKTLIGVGSGASASLATWLIARQVYSKKMEETIKREVDQFKLDYSKRKFGKAPVKPDLNVQVQTSQLDAAEKIMQANGYTPVPSGDFGYLPEMEDIFEDSDDEDDEYDEDDEGDYVFIEDRPDAPKLRASAETVARYLEPHVIDFDVWSEGLPGVDQETLIFYEEDGVLADEHGSIVQEVFTTLGPLALVSFGKGSRDVNVVYVRNPKNSTDYEVLLNRGSYAEEVHGIKPPRVGRPRKMREDE